MEYCSLFSYLLGLVVFSVGDVEFPKVHDHDQGFLVHELLRDDDLGSAEIEHDVPLLPFEGLAL